MHCPPWGLFGGGDGAGNSIAVRIDGEWRPNIPNAKLLALKVKQGDAFMIRSGGGGGFGDPKLRPPERVARDVVEGYVTPEAALSRYGVAVDAASGEIDAAATAKRRSERN